MNEKHRDDAFDQSASYSQPPIVYQTQVAPPQNRGCLYAVIGTVIIVIVICISFFGFADKIQAMFDSFIPKPPPPAVATVDLSNTITNAVVSKGMLVTTESHQSNRNIRVNVVHGLLNANGYGASHFAEGTIFAGIDLESDAVNVSKIDETHYKVTLPAPEITSCSLKPVTQYDRSTTVVADWDALLDLASYMALNEFLGNAIDQGLLDDAEKSGKRVVGDLIHAVVGSAVEVEIVFLTSQTPKIDDTCTASEPRDWNYNSETKEWSPK